MIAYRHRAAGLRVISGPQVLQFPAKCSLDLSLTPEDIFGGVAGQSPFVPTNRKVKCVLNRFTGGVSYGESLKFGRISLADESPLGHVQLDGATITIAFDADGVSSIEVRLNVVCLLLVPLLSLHLGVPVSIAAIRGRIGDSAFEVDAHPVPMDLIKRASRDQRERIGRALQQTWCLEGQTNHRLMVAVNYLHNAYRLTYAGEHHYEFLAESVLNLSKALDALLTPSRKTWRKELRKLGFDEHYIERRVVPIQLIRNEMGVAHCMLSHPTRDQQSKVERFAGAALTTATEVVKRACERHATGDYTPPEAQALSWAVDRADLAQTLDEYLSTSE